MNKRVFTTFLAGAVTLSGMSQVSKTLSPYSQYGLGVLAEQSQGFNRGMGGLSMGLRGGTMVNMLNPASYSAVDSLSMIFDMGVSGQITNFKEGGKRLNRNTAAFDYAAALFRVMPRMGVSVGVLPYSNIGYSFTSQEVIDPTSAPITTSTTDFSGTGGLSQAYVGVGYELLKGLSVGANVSYLWGKYEKHLAISTNNSYVNKAIKAYNTTVNSYKLDFGIQWQQSLNKDNLLTLGAAVGIGHSLGADASVSFINSSPVTNTSDTTSFSLSDAFSLPMSYRAGAAWLYKHRLTVGVDYGYERWGSLSFPDFVSDDAYVMSNSVLRDRHKVTVGADWIPEPNPMVRSSFFKRIHYKLGASYATPYYNIKTDDGPREFSLSAGFAIPIVNSWNNRSLLNISAQWVNSSSKNFINENSFRLTIGLTFNERWFAKWKVD